MPAGKGGEITRQRWTTTEDGAATEDGATTSGQHWTGDIAISTASTLPRLEDDAYQTDPRVPRGYFATFPVQRPHHFLDAGAGCGVWTQALRDHFDASALHPPIDATGVDIQPDLMPRHLFNRRFIGDFLTCPLPHDPQHGGAGYDLIGSNWPYGSEGTRFLLEQFFVHAYYLIPERGSATIFCLTRLNWLGSLRRMPMFQSWAKPSHIAVLSRRPVFMRPVRGDDEVGGTLDPVYGKKSYPTEFCVVRWNYVDHEPYPHSQVEWFDYDPGAPEDVIEGDWSEVEQQALGPDEA